MRQAVMGAGRRRQVWAGRALLGVFMVAGCVAAHGSDGERNQGFLDIEARGDLGGNWSYFFNHQSKVRDAEPRYYLWHVRCGVRYEPVRWLHLALDHRYEEDRGAGGWIRESRSVFEVTPRTRLGRWQLSSRNRLEYRDFESPMTDRWRYRNELKAAHPLPVWDLTGYVSEEPHYDFEQDRWSKHRVTAGLGRRVTSWLELKVYYRWDVIEECGHPGEWDTTRILGIKLVTDMDRLKSK